MFTNGKLNNRTNMAVKNFYSADESDNYQLTILDFDLDMGRKLLNTHSNCTDSQWLLLANSKTNKF